MKELKFSPETHIGIIDNYSACDRTMQALFFTYYAAKRRGSPKCHFGSVNKSKVKNLSFKWDKHLYCLDNKKDFEIAGWSLKFDLCMWYICDDEILNAVKSTNSNCKHAYVVDYYKFSEDQQEFCKKMDYIICPSERIGEMYKGYVPDSKLLVMPPDLIFMDILPANRFRLSKPKDGRKIVVTYLTNTVKLDSPEILMLVSILDVIKELSIIFITYDSDIKQSESYKQILSKYNGRVSFRIDPSDFEIIRLSERKLYYFIDFNKDTDHGMISAIFRNAGIPVLCYCLPIHENAHIEGVTGYYLPCHLVHNGPIVKVANRVHDDLLDRLYYILNDNIIYENLLKEMDRKTCRADTKIQNRTAAYALLPTQGELTKNIKDGYKVDNEFFKYFSVLTEI